jgi:hypothetical protein
MVGKKGLVSAEGGQDLGNREVDPSSTLHFKIWFKRGWHVASELQCFGV